MLFYQDVNEQFEGYTQHLLKIPLPYYCCFIRMSMNNLKDIHNSPQRHTHEESLFYQDVNEQFEGYTQLQQVTPTANLVVLSGCQ